MQRFRILGQATVQDWRYEIALDREAVGEKAGHPVALSERSGPNSSGNAFSLADLQSEIWTNPLEYCGCPGLCQLAREEAADGRPFSVEEFEARWEVPPHAHV